MIDYLIDVVHSFQRKNILVVGDAMLDVYEYAYTSERKNLVSEEKGAFAYKVSKRNLFPGGAANVAANVASLGAHTRLLGVTGADYDLRKVLAKPPVYGTLLVSGSTTVKRRIFIDDKYVMRLDSDQTALTHEQALELLMEFKKHKHETDAIIVSDYAKGTLTEETSVLAHQSIPTIVDFKPVNINLFKGVDTIAINLAEAEEIYKGFSMGRLPDISKVLRCTNVVVTLGANGMCGFDGKIHHVPGYNVPVADTVGCGDTVKALLGLTFDLPLRERMVLANLAASIVIRKRGTATVSPYELVEEIRLRKGEIS